MHGQQKNMKSSINY